MWVLITTVFLCRIVEGNYPVFDYTTRMRILLIPADVRPGSVIYRLRGTDADYDYPLKFDVADEIGKSIIRIENMPCTPTHTYCQANVFLLRRLDPDRVYDLILSLKDTTGRETKVDSTIKATRATSHFEDIFPYVPSVIMVPENTKIGTALDYVLARKNPQNTRHAYLELWGSEKFRIVQNLSIRDVTNGTITLTGLLDFEEKTMYMLHIFALDPFTDPREDTRNIAGFQLAVIVQDEQDMPPVFNAVPAVTKLKGKLKVGEKILKVFAQDGDRGNPRQIRYGLVSEKNPFTTFFNISEKTGEITLAKPIKELMTIVRNHQPIILTVMAEEVKTKLWEPPAMTATVQVVFILEDSVLNSAPYFENQQYVARIAENAPQGTALIFGEPYSTLVKDDDMGKDGVFSLSLENNNGTFEISPTVGERRANFVIRVRNNAMLDFEKRISVVFRIVAKELTPSTTSSTIYVSKANATVYIEDQNDNPPVFLQSRYEAVLAENVTAGTVVTQVQATDADTGLFGKVFYTDILGNPNHSLTIDSISGVITVATNHHGFDRESAEEYRMTVEARDMEGVGNKATVPLIIKLLDVNDNTPEFERQVFEFILQPNLKNFTSRAFVKAIDRDAEEPNNIVRYEIMSGNYENKFYLNEVTGELLIRGKLTSRRRNRSKRLVKRQSDYQDDFYNQRPQGRDSSGYEDVLDSVIVLTVRAYDLGIPHRWQHAHVRIYPPESRARNMNFIVSGSNPDRRKIEELLRQVTGGRVIIQEIKPYTGEEAGTDLSWKEPNSQKDKSVVVATIFYDGNSYVDLNQLETKLTANKTQHIVEATVMEYKNENRVLFWLLIFLLILLIIIIVICVLCCIWQGCCVCPWLVVDRKRVVSPSENVKLLLRERGGHETKGVQAVAYSGRKEAWSGHDNERTYYNRAKNGRDKFVRQMNIENVDMPAAAAAANGTYRPRIDEEGPNVIYTREFIAKERDRQPTMLVEDVEIDPYNTEVKRTEEFRKESDGKLRVTVENDPDSDSMRRHEVERGSDLGKSLRKSDFERLENQKAEDKGYQRIEIDRGVEVGPGGVKEYRLVLERPKRALDDMSDEEILELNQDESNREQYYIRDGNAEILRLVTRGNQEERPRTLVQENDKTYIKLDKGKEIIMKRFMEDQKQSLNENTEDFHQELLRRLQKEYDERNAAALNRPGYSKNSDTSNLQEYISQLLSRNRNDALLLNELIQNYDVDNRTMGYSIPNQETQSLPGQIEISTQTEREFGTQTEELSMLRPPRRKVRSDNEFSDDEIDDGRYGYEKAVTALNLGHGWVKRNTRHPKSKKARRYKIKTPILEEGESANESGIKYDTRPAMFKMPEYELIINGSGPGAYTENKSSILRRRKMKEKILEDAAKSDDDPFLEIRTKDKDEESSEEESIIEIPKKSKTIRRSRRDSMNDNKLTPRKIAKINAVRKARAESLNRLYKAVRELEDQELETIRLETRQRTASLNRLYKAIRELEEAEKTESDLKRARSLSNVSREKKLDRERSFHSLEDENDRDYLRRAGFYKRIKNQSSTTTESSHSKPPESTETSWEELRNKKNAKTVAIDGRGKFSSEKSQESERFRLRETVSEPPKSSKEFASNVSTFGSAEDIHKVPKVKRSKYMDWYKNLNGKKMRKKTEPDTKKREGKKEDDLDSGIAMSSLLNRKGTGKTMIPVKKKNQQMMEKKSVFTIAYDEMHTKNIRPDTNSSQKI